MGWKRRPRAWFPERKNGIGKTAEGRVSGGKEWIRRPRAWFPEGKRQYLLSPFLHLFLPERNSCRDLSTSRARPGRNSGDLFRRCARSLQPRCKYARCRPPTALRARRGSRRRDDWGTTSRQGREKRHDTRQNLKTYIKSYERDNQLLHGV